MEKGFIKPIKGLSGQAIRLIAISAMLCDHLWVTVVQGNDWLTYFGRIAFPLFAFLLVEGFFHTASRPVYLIRLLSLAAISEIPFDLVQSGHPFDSSYQNVLWTLSIGFLAMWAIQTVKGRISNTVVTGLATVLAAAAGAYLSDNLMTDYYGIGVLTVLLFYTMRGLRYAKLGEFLGLVWINVVLLDGVTVDWSLWGLPISFPLQSFALFSLLFIWKYNGRRGPDSPLLQRISYGFYPVHLLILGLLAFWGVTVG